MTRPLTILATLALALTALNFGFADSESDEGAGGLVAPESNVIVQPMPAEHAEHLPANLGPIQPPAPPAAIPTSGIQLTPGMATPEMWFYEQEMRRYADPKAMVRARAEMRADARQARIESMKWFGYSNARPQANPTPFTGTYSPVWSGNGGGYRWIGSGSGPVILQADRSYNSRY